MDLAADMRAMMALSSFGTGEPTVCTIGGVEVPCLPSRATDVDAASFDTVTSGKTRVLRIATADAPDLDNGTAITWNSQNWTVIQLGSFAHGAAWRAFLGKARP